MNPQTPDRLPPELEALISLATRTLNEHTNDAYLCAAGPTVPISPAWSGRQDLNLRPLDPQERATPLCLPRSAMRSGRAPCCWCRVVVCVVVTTVVNSLPGWLLLCPPPARLLDVTAGSTVVGCHRDAPRGAGWLQCHVVDDRRAV